MSLSFDPSVNLVHYPQPMARFGKNKYGENLYRIVWAPSRRIIACAPEGQPRWIQAHRAVGERWILERWVGPWAFCQMSKETWDLTYKGLGPYPDRGEYVHAHTFEACSPADASLEKLIAWIEMGQDTSFQEVRDGVQAEIDRDTQARRAKMRDIIHDAMPDHLGPVSGRYQSRSEKSQKLRRTADSTGLPLGNNKFISLGRGA